MSDENICPLTGESTTIYFIGSPASHRYETSATGTVWLSDQARMAIDSLTPEQKYIVAGICRNRSIKKQGPEMIMLRDLQQLDRLEIPYGFEERARHLLRYLYVNGGKKERLTHHMNSSNDSPITYSTPAEFVRIVKYLKSKRWVEYDHADANHMYTHYQDLGISEDGILEIERGGIGLPMLGLVNQKIYTGDANDDATIEHARSLYFEVPSSLEKKRSACESLSFVMEKYRNESTPDFTVHTSTFFGIVNEFTIRHNKPGTKTIEHEEQLEWIFYSLLNTLNTHMKMRRKLGH